MNYHVENQWGGNTAPWHEGGAWVLGGRKGQGLNEINITSKDGGNTFEGTITYVGEGPIGFKASLVCGFTYNVENSWGGSGGHAGGWWVIGQRVGQACVALNVKSADGGKTLTGTMTYKGEGPIGFKGTSALEQSLKTYVQWGGTSAPWHDNGAMILSSREQAVDSINISSGDNGKTFNGTMQYAGEGPIGTRCTYVMGNTYTVENQWGGTSAPWHPAGQWLIGGRNGQLANELSVKGNPLTGEMQYTGEGKIGFKSEAQS